MINIYKYIDSKNIREFHMKKQTEFNPTEQAIIINRCESIGIDQRLNLLDEILSSYNPDQFTTDYCDSIEEDAYEYIATSVNYKKRALNTIKEDSPEYIFILETSEIENGQAYELSNEGSFSSYGRAYQYIVDKCSKLENSNTRLYSIMTRTKLDSYESPTVCIFNNATMINIQAGDDPTFFDDAEFHIDIPFSAGDIVKYKTINGEFYGVLSDNIKRGRYPNKVGNFSCSLDCFDPHDNKFYYTDSTLCLYLEKCSVSELPEDQRILLALSVAYKDKRKIMSLLMHLQDHSLDALAEEAYEFFIKNKED